MIRIYVIYKPPSSHVGQVSTQFAFSTIVQLYNNYYYNMSPQEYISSESVQLPWIAFLHIDVTSSGENYISGGVVVQQCKLWCTL